MPVIEYVSKKFSPATRRVIDQANIILEEYANLGYSLTLRQLYYQFVARGLIPNRDTEYKRLGSIINDARLAGLIDWEAIEDRTRELKKLTHWRNPQEILTAVAEQYRVNLWDGQPNYVEVWVEKEALAGIVQAACEPLDVPYFSCRGYTSQSEMWVASQRLYEHINIGQDVYVIHLGDHDPSGIDMTRDIEDRLQLFMGGVEVNRIALTMDQVVEYRPPPNPAKMTDSRFRTYIASYGGQSWELDALDPVMLNNLITNTVLDYVDEDLMNEKRALIEAQRAQLQQVANRWDEIVNGN